MLVEKQPLLLAAAAIEMIFTDGRDKACASGGGRPGGGERRASSSAVFVAGRLDYRRVRA
jgi:hypothetical protein